MLPMKVKNYGHMMKWYNIFGTLSLEIEKDGVKVYADITEKEAIEKKRGIENSLRAGYSITIRG